jgi:hypothetical protein
VPHPGPDQLTLAAPAEPIEPQLAAHLAICTICHAEVASLRHTVDLARANPTDPAANTGSPPVVCCPPPQDDTEGPKSLIPRTALLPEPFLHRAPFVFVAP